MKKLFSLMVCLTVVCFTISSFAEQKREFSTFRIIPPEGWGIVEKPPQNTVNFKHPLGYLGFSVQWDAPAYSKEDMLSEPVIQALTENYQMQFPEFERWSGKRSLFNQLDALEIIGTYQSEEVKVIMFMGKKWVFSITYGTFVDGHKVDVDAVRKSLATFEET